MRRGSGNRCRTLPPAASSATSDLQPKANDPIKNSCQLMTAITQPATASCLARPVMLLLLSFSAGLASMQPCAATPFEWEYTGSLNTARFHHTSTLLPDGRVLVVGGEYRSTPLASSELYDPASGTWSATGSLNTARDSHTATHLPNGKVLVAGGRETDPGPSRLNGAPRWQRPGPRRRVHPRSTRHRRTLRSGDRHLVTHRQPQRRARGRYRNSVAQRHGARGGGNQLRDRHCRTLRSGDR